MSPVSHPGGLGTSLPGVIILPLSTRVALWPPQVPELKVLKELCTQAAGDWAVDRTAPGPRSGSSTRESPWALAWSRLSAGSAGSGGGTQAMKPAGHLCTSSKPRDLVPCSRRPRRGLQG